MRRACSRIRTRTREPGTAYAGRTDERAAKEGVRFEDGKADPSRRIGWEELEHLIGADEPPAEVAA